MNKDRNDFINALISGDPVKIKELKDQEIERCKGKIIFAEENKDHTWHPILICFAREENGWKDMHKYPNMSAEDFASLIVKYDFQVMEMSHGVYINGKFPEHSDYYEPPDPTMTPEKKYREILDYLKELSTRIPEIGYYDEKQPNNAKTKS
jgi:hypothetical protein